MCVQWMWDSVACVRGGVHTALRSTGMCHVRKLHTRACAFMHRQHAAVVVRTVHGEGPEEWRAADTVLPLW